ncbi:ABC transporter permease [Gordonia sp. CPCC 206044]|uniref:ABC transporter permease n=1 Tax=Gordonia sp. CPCC 206044 TaxID=3140793 RepID=UPI003AF3CF24
MLLTVASRLGRSIVVVLLVTIAVVALLSLAPGSASEVILGENATPTAVAEMDEKLGLDRPVPVQYVDWLSNAVRGDLGSSPLTNQSVTDAIIERLPVTLELALLGLVIALAVAILMGVLSASRPGSLTDRGINALSAVFLSVPAFVAGPVLIYFFAIQLQIFPVLGWSDISDGLGENLRSALLPAIAISLTEIASFHRLLRTDLIATLGEDYISAARAKGMSSSYVLFRHAFRPSSFSLITLAGMNLGRLIGGTVIVETLFGLPGLGQLIASSITNRDLIMVQGIVVFIAVTYVLINTVVDLSYGLIDPRVRKVAAAA